ncbi:ABC transporter substrate-binding protein [Flavihumibacter sp. ZG627]|uniref:ABC transporter substrate-binding protein n=1 Tax=Flavihumibacter sp. ZG627 TaxID=1463156 RepID=UPI00057F3EEC|nr:ABC transporter substrate-binding protein [Flavihumibacter sp. ZG627]KIC90149.1 ABC transporter substrate-binding protein [Flavihumibacter sp. ZG627]
MQNKHNCLILLFVGLFVFLVSCSSTEKQEEGFFLYNESSGIASLDPAFSKNQSIMWAVHQLYSTLVEVDSALKIKPSVASHWEISEDGLTYTFYLRTDVFFHDNDCFPKSKGRKLVAEDVVYSLKRIMDPVTSSSGAWIFNDRVKRKNGFRALNDSVFQLELIRPFPPILGILSMQYCSIIPEEAVLHYGNKFRDHPVGSGPFRFIALEEGQSLIMRKHENYFEIDSVGNRLPYLAGIKVSFYDSKATEFLLFRQKKLHFINDIDPSFKDEVLNKRGQLREEWKGRIILSKYPYLNTEYLGILVESANPAVKNSPLRFREIRQAINHGFDRKKMMLYLRNSIGIAAESGFIPAGLPSFNAEKVKGYSYDPERSKELIRKAGFTNGKEMPSITLLTIPIYADLASYIARELEEIGIIVKVEVVQKSLLLEQTAQGTAFFFRGSWIADYPDAENYLSVFYSRNPAPPNYTRYKNKEYDQLYEKALQEPNDSSRYTLYQEMDAILINDAPVVPLWYDEVIRLVQPGVSGFYPNALNLLELRTTVLTR